MRLKTGKDEIVYLLEKVFEKYEEETGEQIIRNTNRKNYEGAAKRLSEISNELPNTADSLDHELYSPDYNPKNLEHPFRKYDITSSQIKDAYAGIVSNPRHFLVDACYIYLYNIGRKGFEKNPIDSNLLTDGSATTDEKSVLKKEQEVLKEKILALEKEKEDNTLQSRASFRKQKSFLVVSLCIAIGLLAWALFQWQTANSKWGSLKKDMNILPYEPTQAEIDSLEGIWLCYTGSPQARLSDPNRYHMVVSNVVDVKYKDGYFTFNRYGASFDHVGYMQFESPWMVSIHSYIKNKADSIESPRHSLMQLDKEKPFVSVVSASWNFDIGSRNNVIGIREVYIKKGKGGRVEEVMNTIENASCRCKIIRWHQENGSVVSFNLRNELLESIPEQNLRTLLDENSILLRVPQQGIIIKDSSAISK